jgi:hypothetical protein
MKMEGIKNYSVDLRGHARCSSGPLKYPHKGLRMCAVSETASAIICRRLCYVKNVNMSCF